MYKIRAYENSFDLYDKLGWLQTYPLVGDCLERIARDEDVPEQRFSSESHLLAYLLSVGIKIKLLEEDGSEMTW